MNGMKKGLVLEGGAMRGMFTAGVLDIFMDRGIDFDGIVGVSAGAIFGSNYKSKQRGRTIRYNVRFCNDPRYVSLLSLIFTGDLYNKDFAYGDLPNIYDIFDAKIFSENPMEFYAVCSDVETGQPVYYKCEKGDADDITWIRASGSMPLASKIVEIGGKKLLDGGITDSIPVRFFLEKGYEKPVVILTQPEGFVKKPNKLMPILRIALRKYPKIIDALAHRHEVYNETTKYIAEQQKKGNIYVIRPPEALKIGAVEHDPNELERVYNIGIETGERCADEVIRFLSE